MREGMLHIRDVVGPKKTGSMEMRLEAMEQQVFKCQGMVERGLNANHMMITEFTSKHKMDANDIGKHLSRLYDRVDQLQGQIYDLQNQNYDEAKMEYYSPTFQLPPTILERRYPTCVIVEKSPRVWTIECWRGARDLAEWFLRAGVADLPTGSPVMFQLEEMRTNSSSPLTRLIANFANRFDAYHLLGKVFWCGCDFIAFTTYNIFMDLDRIFSTHNVIHSLPYYLSKKGTEEEK
ncbi:40S ribosomal protein S5-1 [Hordeum vulgare]|nr:40S ribosomal protein S5-1 [Hordeum vulgare]